MGTGSFLGVKSGRGVPLTPHPIPVSKSWKGRAIPLLPLRAVRPVQSLIGVQGCTLPYFTMKLILYTQVQFPRFTRHLSIQDQVLYLILVCLQDSIYLPQSQKLKRTKNAGSSRANCDFVSASEEKPKFFFIKHTVCINSLGTIKIDIPVREEHELCLAKKCLKKLRCMAGMSS